MKKLNFGDIAVERLVEAEGPSFFPAFIFPEHDPDALEAERSWTEPHFYDPASGRFIMSLHSYIIRTAHHTILVDTCVGNDKERPSTKPWHHLQTPWLENLGAMGMPPESVDFVLCTHLHVDHVGWNTRLENGRWVPTFPNAKYLFNKTEYAHWEAEAKAEAGADRSGAGDDCFGDSVLPVVEAGQVLFVEGDHAIDDALQLEPTPGHTPGHVCLNLEAGGARAVFSGDLMHHPVQCAYPEWNSRFCVDPAQSRATRQGFVERHADTDTLILGAHFAAPTAGRIVANGGRCKLQV
ncbi:MAG: MBL fold metallo-hydrolase [Alphaproteobacteria bacterium]|jgi:glyoxylase-like metal-dependent hydrolase (beta-lactamase superfamily II)|nr:MBL fold metallo-hydrolase [Alphaproteobacteria bacterium]